MCEVAGGCLTLTLRTRDEWVWLVPGVGANGATAAVIFDNLTFTVVELRTPRLLADSTFQRDGQNGREDRQQHHYDPRPSCERHAVLALHFNWPKSPGMCLHPPVHRCGTLYSPLEYYSTFLFGVLSGY